MVWCMTRKRTLTTGMNFPDDKGSPRQGGRVRTTAAPLIVNGYHLLVWPAFAERWRNLNAEVGRLRDRDPES
jgi:hypothetical protein